MIHKYFLNGYYIVIDTNSGAVHIVDELAYRILDFFTEKLTGECPDEVIVTLENEGFDRQDIIDTYAELKALCDDDSLFSEDTYRPFADMLTEAPIKSMCLNIAHDCNLRCEYCFAAQGDFGHGRKLMPFEVGKAAIDFLIKHSANRHNLELDFFGGEPLMNFDVVKQVVEYARSVEKEHNKNFRFTITTNGVLLDDDSIDFINREMSNVVLSLDGRKEVNDRLRPTVNKKGSYDIIVPKYQKLVEARGDKEYYVRGTFTKYNLDFADDVMHLNELGFDQISVEPVVAPDEEPYAIKEADLPQILEEYDRLAAEYVKRHKEGRGFTFFHFMLDLTQGPCVAKRLSGCGSGTEYLAVTPWGDLYPCHQFVGNEDFLLGNVDTGVTNTAVRDEFKLCNVYAKDKCRDCFARFYCSGGCAANSYNFHGSITDAYDIGCEMQKKRIECAIMIRAALAEDEENN